MSPSSLSCPLVLPVQGPARLSEPASVERPIVTCMTPGAHGVRVSPVMLARDDLVALAARRSAAAEAGNGHLILLAGEAGIGKTRLLDHLCAQARDSGWRVVRAAAFPRDVEVVAGLLLDLGDELSRSADPLGA